MKMLSATVIVLRSGPDHVSIQADLPDPQWPFKESLCLKFECARGSAHDYLAEHFPELEVTTVGERV